MPAHHQDFDPGKGVLTEALQMLLIPQERIVSFVLMYALFRITYGEFKCGFCNCRGLQRGLWVC